VAISTAYGTLVPQRPGANYLHADGRWQRVELPAGRSTLQLRQGTLLVDTGHRRGLQPDGPECAAALLVAPSIARCPDQALAAQDATALRALTRWLRDGGVRARSAYRRMVRRGAGRPRGCWEPAAAYGA
jgi:hypothetical protein